MTIIWRGHFYNEEHSISKYLAAINDHHTPIATGYEEITGQPPMKRSLEMIPNVNGTYRYQFTFATDHDGGRSIAHLDASSLIELPDFLV